MVIDSDEGIGCESFVELCSDVSAFNKTEEKTDIIRPEGVYRKSDGNAPGGLYSRG